MFEHFDKLTFQDIRKDNPGLFDEEEGGTILVIPNRDFDVWVRVFEYAPSHVVINCKREYLKFPETIRKGIAELHSKCWLVSYSYNQLSEFLPGTNITRWMAETFGPSNALIKETVETAPPGKFVKIIAEAKILLCYVETFLFQIKSALDIFAPVIGKGLGCMDYIRGFNKKGSDVGGQFLDILTNNIPTANRELANKIDVIIRNHKTRWLDRAVQMRDRVTHHRSFASELRFTATHKHGEDHLTFHATFENQPIMELLQEFRLGFTELLEEIVPLLKASSTS